ncbi:hypothetical protein CVU37_06680 [candidate division BRC1 bacterium HGW-BRC1-1]|jgi:restriction system protein|nr:MAG: hypothetical protein CVU37_06680 [candidate division BRC1 bacterium HGW-BRC1-1]
MGRKRKEDILDVFHVLFQRMPWWSGPPVACLVYVGIKLFGAFLASFNSPYNQISAMTITLAPIATVLVLAVWLMALLGKGKRRFLLATRKEIDSIRALSWRDFELLVGEALRRQGYTVNETGGGGADGGIDLIARRGHEKLLVQCKRWKTWKVDVKVVREMFGVMTAEHATSVMIVTSGEFSKPAIDFAEGKPIRLMDGAALVKFIATVKSSAAEPSSAKAVEARPPEVPSAPTPPTVAIVPAEPTACPKCGSPMIERVAKKGSNAGQKFFGCSTFPRCNGVRDI